MNETVMKLKMFFGGTSIFIIYLLKEEAAWPGSRAFIPSCGSHPICNRTKRGTVNIEPGDLFLHI